MRFYSLLILVLTALLVTSAFGETPSSQQENEQSEHPRPKVIILMIADGMGFEHMEATRQHLRLTDPAFKGKLHMDQLPVKSDLKTMLHGRYVTDSAASGTAFACGEHHHMNAVSVGRNKKSPLPTVVDQAKSQGWKVGIVSSVSMDHATPACFYAHDFKRKNFDSIAKQLLVSPVDFFGGGGFLAPANKDNQLLKKAQEEGFQLARTPAELKELVPGKPILAINHRLDKSAALPNAELLNEGDLTLPLLTKESLRFLKNDQGIFIMIEGGKIDWYGHDNNLMGIIHQMLAFDKAVAEALKYYETHPKETLLLVTSDHETGDLVRSKEAITQKNPLGFTFRSGGHTGKKVPMMAIGLGSEYFNQTLSNVEVGQLLFKLIGGKKVKAPKIQTLKTPKKKMTENLKPDQVY